MTRRLGPLPRKIAWTGVVTGALLACTPTLNWRELPTLQGSATFVLPCKPEHTARTVPLGGLPTDLTVAGCDAAGTTFAVMSARLPPGIAPGEVLAGWQQATLANMRAAPDSVQRRVFRPHGGLPLPQAERLHASGQRPNGQRVQMHAAWSARSTEAGTELLHAVLYAQTPSPDASEAFFEALRWR